MTKRASKFDALFNISRVSDESGTWIVEGYATTADLDLDDGYITEEALRGAENDLLKYSTLLYNHDRNAELGKVLETKYIPEERALWIKAMISKTVPEVWEKIKEGVLNKFSINGRALEWSDTLIKGMDKVVTVIKSLTLFEASLVTVPADASARTLASYVERSIKNHNSKEDISMKKKVSRETKDIGRDKERVEALVSSIEEALNAEDTEVHAQAMRSVLDFLKSLLATEYNTADGDSERAASNLKALIDEAVSGPIGELASQMTVIAESIKGMVEKSIVEASKEEKKEEKKEVEKSAEKEEKKEVKKSVEKEEKEEKKEDEVSIQIKKMGETISGLEKLVKDSMPIRRAPGAEEHKEDEREQKSEEKDITKTTEYKDAKTPVDRLKMFLGNISPE